VKNIAADIGFDAGAYGGFLSFGSGDLPPNPYRPIGGNVYYTSGFLPSGANQLSLGGTLIGGLTNILGAVTQRIAGGGPIVGGPVDMSALPARVPTGGTIAQRAGEIVGQHPVLTAVGGAAGVGAAVMGLGGAGAFGVGHRARYAPAGTKGYHPIKRGPHAGMWTRNRHRNVANIRALRRALSRAHGFARIARKVMSFTHPGKRGRMVFKRRGRARR
jgi:hypothetical protein